MRVKVALTLVAALTVTTHAPVPLQPPLHPVKVDVASGVAIKVTAVPEANGAVQLAPQLRPAGLEVMTPAPVPDLDTVRS